jgi:Holliday junction resolvase RusA-like endonuclease
MSEKRLIKFVITGRCPSKKNSKIKAKNGIFSSKAHEEWKRNALYQMMAQKVPQERVICSRTQVRIFFPDYGRADLSNKFDSIADMMTEYGVWKDDNWKCTGTVILIPEYSKNNPKVEVVLEVEDEPNYQKN